MYTLYIIWTECSFNVNLDFHVQKYKFKLFFANKIILTVVLELISQDICS